MDKENDKYYPTDFRFSLLDSAFSRSCYFETKFYVNDVIIVQFKHQLSPTGINSRLPVYFTEILTHFKLN